MSRLELREQVSIGLRSTLLIAIIAWTIYGSQEQLIDYNETISLVKLCFGFFFYSAALFTATIVSKNRSRLNYYMVLLADLIVLSLLTIYTGGLGSIFYLAFFLIVGTFALTFGLAPGVTAACFAIVLFALVNYGELTSEVYVDFIFRSLALVVSAIGIGFLAEKLWEELEDDRSELHMLRGEGEKMRKQIQELRAVSEVANLIHSTLDLKRLSSLVVEVLANVFEMDTCALTIINKKSGQTIFSAERGIESDSLNKENEQTFSTEFDVAVGMHERPFFKCMLLLDEEDVTAMLYTTEETSSRLQQEDFQIMTSIATQLLIAIENVRLYELTKKYSITDELTQLYNYRYLQGELRQELERSKRYARPVSFLMIDVDHFKKYNDTYGHIKGDIALTEIAVLLKRCCREIDRVARYGGEEFAVILPETDSTGAYIVAEKMRESVANHRFLGKEEQRDAAMTISIGVASFPEHAGDQEELLKAADNALYLAKNKGRNRTFGPDATTHKAS